MGIAGMKSRRCYAWQKRMGADGQWPVGVELRLDTMMQATFAVSLQEMQPWHATWLLRRVLDAMGVNVGNRGGLTWHQWVDTALRGYETRERVVPLLPNPLTRQGVTLRNALSYTGARIEYRLRVRFNSRKAERAFWRKVQVERAADVLALAGGALTVGQLRDEALR